MQNENVTGDSIQMTDFDHPKLNSTLNVLTILTRWRS